MWFCKIWSHFENITGNLFLFDLILFRRNFWHIVKIINWKHWRLGTESSCFLCKRSIYTWKCKWQSRTRIAVAIKDFLSSHEPIKLSAINSINLFIKGEKPKTTSHRGFYGILNSASDWSLEFDLKVFLSVSILSPVILLLSLSSKNVITIELTCPVKENMSQWHKDKYQKYYQQCYSVKYNLYPGTSTVSRRWHPRFLY